MDVRPPAPPSAGYLTSSEVATLDFLRTELSIPVPRLRVESYVCPDINLGAEFILMETLTGIRLRDIWTDLTGKETMNILKQVVQVEEKLFIRPLSEYGRIY